MIWIIAGSRTLTSPDDRRAVFVLLDHVHAAHGISRLLSGLAAGPDLHGVQWAQKRGVPVTGYPADWKRYGPQAGFRRNQQMAEIASGLAVWWDGQSRGTADMIARAQARGLILRIDAPPAR